MTRGIGVGLIVLGIILLIFGFQASESAGAEIQEFFTGTPPDRAIWMIAGGAFALVAGIVMSFIKPKV